MTLFGVIHGREYSPTWAAAAPGPVPGPREVPRVYRTRDYPGVVAPMNGPPKASQTVNEPGVPASDDHTGEVAQTTGRQIASQKVNDPKSPASKDYTGVVAPTTGRRKAFQKIDTLE